MNNVPSFEIRKTPFQMPTVAGLIERRMLLNFRCRADVLQKVLPAPFRPKLINGWGMAGICLIRLGQIRPSFLPGIVGLTSENAAHRIAVEWDNDGIAKEGVFIPRRDTNGLINRLVGGRLFPGQHHGAKFRTAETNNHFELEMRSDDQVTFVCVRGHVGKTLPSDSVFRSLNEASEFFRRGSLGWSSRATANTFDGLELSCDKWLMEPMSVERVESSFFDNREFFPGGSAMFDSAFLMRNIPHEWHDRGRLTVERAKI